eukprot:TRINITY_DN7204_c0_g1_i1.p1 TRINITY_DN7204_c0_g1~~TRINITY_DN7204_c0_g1_i1.p1  ORF type:complete len:201 (+),score=33.67 TRINITY_DN7204_c0_g1_i1:92-694(+)
MLTARRCTAAAEGEPIASLTGEIKRPRQQRTRPGVVEVTAVRRPGSRHKAAVLRPGGEPPGLRNAFLSAKRGNPLPQATAPPSLPDQASGAISVAASAAPSKLLELVAENRGCAQWRRHRPVSTRLSQREDIAATRPASAAAAAAHEDSLPPGRRVALLAQELECLAAARAPAEARGAMFAAQRQAAAREGQGDTSRAIR